MTTLTLLLCAIGLCLSFNYGNAIVNESDSKKEFVHLVPPVLGNSNSEPDMAIRRELIKSMTLEAFKLAKDWPGHKDWIQGTLALDVIQMLSSLWVMELRDEYEEGKRWIEQNYNSARALKELISIFSASTEYMGSMLSCYALTNDTTWLASAKLIGDALKMDFNTPTGLPFNAMASKRNRFQRNYYDNNLAEVGGQHLEFIYLADMINDLDMKAKVRKARTFLQNVKKPYNGLYMYSIDISTGEWIRERSSLIWPASTFYQYLIKSYVQSNGQDEQAIEMYRDAIDAVVNNSIIQKSEENGLTYVYEPQFDGKHMDYSSCYLGAMLALGADAMQRQFDRSPFTVNNVIQQTSIDQHWTLAKEITETCHKHANSSRTKLPSWNDKNKAFSFEIAAAYAESYFVLWRLTHESKYRDYAWELAQAIHKHCRTDEGSYFHLEDVEGDYQIEEYKPTRLKFLVSNTLNYLYLTFADDSLLPLDQWVFNRAGQPLPITGRNPAYPAQKGCY